MLTRLRDTLHRAITTGRGDAVGPVRVAKDIARRLNATLGSPLADRSELELREAARARLASLRRGRGATPGETAPEPNEAPIVIYFEKDRNVRELQRIEEVLTSKRFRWTRLDVSGDQPAIDFVMRQAKCDQDELPVVFVADRAIGGYGDLVDADNSGELARLVRGA